MINIFSWNVNNYLDKKNVKNENFGKINILSW